MNDLQRIEGKTISSIEKEFDGKNSSIIIKFKEGGKVNISSYPNGDQGVGQFDVELGKLKEDDLIGKRIHSTTEEFDGTNDFIVFTFKDSSKMTITSFSSSEDSTAGLDISVYTDPNKLVAESLEELFENSYTDARNGQYPMNNPQYESNDGRFINVVIKYDPRSNREILKLLNNEFEMAKYAGDVGMDGFQIIDVFGDDATIESVSDVLYKYIENGTVYSVDEI